jgi:hypothetical protein
MDLKIERDENGSGLRPMAVASQPSGFINVRYRPKVLIRVTTNFQEGYFIV